MNAAKKKKLQDAGWTVGSTSDFLSLSEAENTVISMKLALASRLKELRKEQQITQQELADQIGSSQSRVAKMEIADKSVSIEMFVRSLATLGSSQAQIGMTISSSHSPTNQKHLERS